MKLNSKPSKFITNFALYTFLFLSLGATVYLSQTILELEQKGLKTTGKLLEITWGVKGSNTYILQFETLRKEIVETKSLGYFPVVSPKLNEPLNIRYLPENPLRAMADIGFWNWQGPIIFGTGALILLGLVIFLPRLERHAAPGSSP